MHTKTTMLALTLALTLAPTLAACGGSADTEASTATMLTQDQIMDAAFEACPLSIDDAFDILVSTIKDGVATVTFSSKYGDFSYTIDAYTGEVVDKVEPAEALEALAQNPLNKDAVGLATSACLDAYAKNGAAENIESKARTDNGVQKVRVQFDYEGKHYDLDYDVATGKISEYSADAESAANAQEASSERAAAEAEAQAAAKKATNNGTKKLDADTAADMALQAAFKIYDKEGKSDNLETLFYTEGGAQKVEVQFDIEGKHYDLIYDVATGVFTDK